MSSQSVAEIIGWELQTIRGCDDWWIVDGKARYSSPNVDDLLAWLNDKLFHLWFEVYGDPAALPEDWYVYANWTHVIRYGVEEERHIDSGIHRTLLECFESIVRQVAADRSEEE